MPLFDRDYADEWRNLRIYRLYDLSGSERQAPARKLTHLHARAYRWQPPLEEITRELFQRLETMKNEEKALMNRPWLDFLATFSAQAGRSPP